MDWFNYYGLIILFIILIPNIVFSIKHPESFKNYYSNRIVIILEQIGRFGSFIFMIINVPYTYFNFWFDDALMVYFIINAILLIIYLVGWIICWNKRIILRSYLLSITPSLLFFSSGILLLNVPLIVFSLIFAYCHIRISIYNAKMMNKERIEKQ